MRLTRYTTFAVIVGLSYTIVGVVALWVSSELDDATWQSVVANVASVLITAGVLSISYEAFLRRTLLNDVRRAQEQSEQLVKLGLTQMTLVESECDYAAYMGKSRDVHILPAEPSAWTSRGLPWVLELAGSNHRISIYLPEHIGTPPHGANNPTSHSEIAREIRAQWDGASRRLHKRSTLTVYRYRGSAHSGFVLGAGVLILTVPAASGPLPGAQNALLVFQDGTDPSAIEWARNVLKTLPGCISMDSTAPEPRQSASEIIPFQAEPNP